MQVQPMVSSGFVLLAVALLAGLILIFAFVLVLVLLARSQERRQWEHAERLKALEMGQGVPERVSEWARALVCVAIGAGVPVGAFLFTGLATVLQKVDTGIWLAPTIVGAAAVYYGYCLASKLFTGDDPDEEDEDEEDDEDDTRAARKPAMEADALDVVSQRGG